MARSFYNLPSLTTLAAFETAARKLSFKKAAQELNVTPGAVSHQIKALEAEIGGRLFERKHHGVVLTQAGEELHSVLHLTFSEISRVLVRIRKSPDDVSVSIASTTAVSSLWLMPRMVHFWKEHPEIPVNQFVSDGGTKDRQLGDLSIVYGKRKSTTQPHWELFRDHLAPVCSPDISDSLHDMPLAVLAGQSLIHLEADDDSWTTWQRWFSELNYKGPISRGIRVNNYMTALQAAQDGGGIVLGWQNLVRPILKTGRLVALNAYEIPAPESFFITTSNTDTVGANTKILRDWLLNDA